MAITEYEDKIQEIIDKNDHDSFIADFLSVYEKIPRATITKLRKGIGRINLSKEPGEVYLKNKLYYKATDQPLMQTYADLKKKIDELGSKPRYIFVTNFKDILAKDTKTNDSLSIKFEDLPQYFEFFLAWNGIEKAEFEKENPADVRAAERFAKLYDIITKDNPDATAHGLNLFLIRLLFCLFAEDTGIFEQDLFTNDVMAYTKADGSDFDSFIKTLFENLDVQENLRSASLPGWVKKYPYVDGDLFIEPHESLKFTVESRSKIIDAGKKLNWDSINPDILGSMIQAVAAEDVRSHLGMHYTSVPNIMKVIKPLFLDELREEFEKAKGSSKKLQALYDRLGKIKFMDPACGSGNFLVVTYKELRQLEIDILKEENNLGVATMYIPSVTLNQFYGIEIDDFACDVARLSLWIAEHQMNKKLSEQVTDAVRPTLPLQHVGGIVHGNALRLDWNEVMPHEDDEECYVYGNPPYLGYSLQDSEQKKDMEYVFKSVLNYKRIDYIAGWFYKATKTLEKTSNSKFAFVTTNSINQGEQVSNLWPHLLSSFKIFFAYPSFKWSNNAAKNAAVIVSIIGLEHKDVKSESRALIFTGNLYRKVENINAYLIPGENVIVKSERKSLFGLPKITNGCRPVDGGHLILTSEEKDKLLNQYPELSEIVKRSMGASEFLHSKLRYTLWMNESQYYKFSYVPEISERVRAVRKFRINGGDSAKSVADTPWAYFLKNEYINSLKKFHETHSGSEEMMSIIIPRHSSGARFYVPMGIVGEKVLITDSANVIYNAPIWLLGLLESRMHMLWLNMVGGKLKNDFRYAGNLVYNTFPVPHLTEGDIRRISDKTLNILDIREEEGDTLDNLYGSPLSPKLPKAMNPRLKQAHHELDKIVDSVYKRSGFSDDDARRAYLLKMYEEKVKDVK